MPVHPPSLTTPHAGPPLRGFAIAGAVVLVGLLAVMFWPAEPVITAKATRITETPKIAAVQPVQLPRAGSGFMEETLGSKLALETTEAPEITKPEFEELSLTQSLDDFFLQSVSLENLPLGQAMARLKQMLQETDKHRLLALHKLVVTIPTSALGRPVTLVSTSISYLEAVRTLATLAGCEVDLGERRITLKTLPGPWPQVAKRRSIVDMLDGLLTKDGKPMSEDPGRVAKLKNDASRLGLSLDDAGSSSMTESQWQTLRRMMEYRDRLDRDLIPPVVVYLLPQGYLPPLFQLTPQQALQVMTTLYQQGFAAYSDVPYALLDPAIAQQIVIIAKVGMAVIVTQYSTTPAVVDNVAVVVPTTPVPVYNNVMSHDVMLVAYSASLQREVPADADALQAFFAATGAHGVITTLMSADQIHPADIVIPVDPTGTPMATTNAATATPDAAPATPATGS